MARIRGVFSTCSLSLALALLLAPPSPAHESAMLRPADGSGPARGEARLGEGELRVRGDGLASDISLTIWIAGSDGQLALAYSTQTESNGSFEVRDSVADPSAYAGRAVEVRGEGDVALLRGSFPEAADRDELGRGAGQLLPPAGALNAAATGRIQVKAQDGRHAIEVRIRGLTAGEVYTVCVINATGETQILGSITATAGGNGALEVDTQDGGSLPFGAGAVADLVGLTVQVKAEDGTVVLDGLVPALGASDDHPEERQQEVEFDLSRPAGSPDADIVGDVNIAEEIGSNDHVRVRIKKDGDPNATYTVTARKPDSEDSETLFEISTDSKGEGEALKKGRGVYPFGAVSLSELGGIVIEVADSEGRVVLSGIVPQVGPIPGPPPVEVERLKLVVLLSRPEPAVDPNANGKLELEEEDDEHELEVEVQDLNVGETYRVELRDTSGAAEVLLEAAADSFGDLRSRKVFVGRERLPLDVTSFRAYDGFTVVVLDASGATVLQAVVTIPGGGGAGIAASVSFSMVGAYDAPFLRGDFNRDQTLNLTDAVNTLEALFLGRSLPVCLDALDSNDDGSIDIADPVATLVHLFIGARELPFPGALISGFDPTADDLSCQDP